ncbi:hypothetical protein L2E82_10546 [Cichorium intybus]|uniref:Uncharacterized protein n=1 Tax=Cichorium intybus TaxID=13427 RepID=A0ACB9GAR7_CICIN|nr:hypothetical protein L2E82_10546 [Cichorium intybus]
MSGEARETRKSRFKLEIRPLKNIGNNGSKTSHQRATAIAPSFSFSNLGTCFTMGKIETLISDALRKMKGKILEIAGSHVSCRVLQTCAKYCSQDERNAVFEELPSKEQLAGFISSLHGHVASLLRHMVGSVVVEHAYQLGNATQKQALLMELYSTELQLVNIISKLNLQKRAVLRHMASVFQPILEKGIVDHSILHTALVQYFTIADKAVSREACFTALESESPCISSRRIPN